MRGCRGKCAGVFWFPGGDSTATSPSLSDSSFFHSVREPRFCLLVAHSPGGQLADGNWVEADEKVRARRFIPRRGARRGGCSRRGQLWRFDGAGRIVDVASVPRTGRLHAAYKGLVGRWHVLFLWERSMEHFARWNHGDERGWRSRGWSRRRAASQRAGWRCCGTGATSSRAPASSALPPAAASSPASCPTTTISTTTATSAARRALLPDSRWVLVRVKLFLSTTLL